MSVELRLRNVDASDAYALWIWANDPETRRGSHGRPYIEWDEHLTWLALRLASPDAYLWLAETDRGRPAGTIRFETDDGWRTARLSYTVAGESRGLGLGRRLVVAGVERLHRHRPAVRVRADVQAENERSVRVFAGLNWRCEEHERGLRQYWLDGAPR